ncbi:MAG: hypothetical protein AABY07_10350 [Nanoarchaeota archaeon]
MKRGRAQAASDYVIIGALVFIIVIPLTAFLISKISVFKKTQITDISEAVKNSVSTVYTLTPKSSTKLTIDIPNNVNTSIEANRIIIDHKRDSTVIELPVNLVGTFPQNPGRHTIILYNNEDSVIVSECGNSIIESPVEQCEQTNNTNCNSGAAQCILSGSYKCLCPCNYDFECFTQICDTSLGVCTYCDPPLVNCPTTDKYVCINGICVKEEEPV